MLRLLLLRHAKSAWPAGAQDRERPLAPRGRRATPVMGAYLAEQRLLPGLVIVSPARRTLETWVEISRDWPSYPPVRFEERVYEASPERLLKLVRAAPAASPLLVIGHNPGMQELARQLLSLPERGGLLPKYPTAGLAVIDLDAARWADIVPGTGRLNRFVTPRSLGVEEA